ncbi:MAG: hypothetical protein OEY47_05410 [Candidatus Bathyarchaeota archaeon]|nr:hypothetical protein [Candidatus Bathyarchaeota archaeon]MDH5701224.1 hypothetical protein [Candidatus Bathyarchaeota archaeon]
MPRRERRHEEQDKLGFASLGFFLLLIGVIWLITPNLSQAVADFFNSFTLEKEVFPNVFLPSPAHHHPVVYTAVARFCFVFSLFQIVILVLRFFFRDPLNRVIGTFSGIVFWLGVGFVSNLLAAEALEWFGFLGWLIVFIGLSLVVRSLLVLLFGVALRKL